MAPVPSSKPPRYEWRRGGKTLESARTQRWVGRALTTLLLSVLLAVLVYVLVIRASHVHFAALPVADYDPFVVPPIAFSQEDVDAFAQVAPKGAFLKLQELQTFDGMGLLQSRLAGRLRSSRDGVILYLSAHGVADGGVAYLLCSDYRRPGAAIQGETTGRYKLSEVLRQLSGCRAAWKLLLLDAGQSSVDLQCGLPANEFPRLLRKEIEELDDPTLWVLTANRPLQISHVSYAARRSMFSYYVTEGLRGGADRDGNRMVSLAELDRFVREGVAAWAQWEVGTPAAQVPQLLHAGRGRSPETIELVAVGRRSPDRDDSAKDESAKDPESPHDPSKTDADDAPRKTATPKKAPGAAPQLPALEHWTRRDRFRDLAPDGKWAPVDYAPHLWRVFENALVEHDRRDRWGAAHRREPVREGPRPQLPDFSLYGSGGFVDDQRLGFPPGEAFAPLRQAIQHKNRLLARVPGYVRYRAHAIGLTGSGRGPAYDELIALVSDLKRLVDGLEWFERRETIDLLGGSVRQQIDELAGLAKALAEKERHFRRQLNEEGRSLASRPKDQGAAARILALLETPLLDTDVRAALAAAVASLDAEAPSPSQLPSGFAKNPDGHLATFTARQWRLLAEQAELEGRLVQLADPDHEIELPTGFAGNDGEQRWLDYRRFSGQLDRFYAALPQRINERLASAEVLVRRSAGRLLRFLPVRDFDRIEGDFLPATVPGVRPPPPPPGLALVFDPPDAIELVSGSPTAWTVDVGAQQFRPETAEYRVEFAPELIELRNLDTGVVVPPDEPTSFALHSGRAQLRFEAEPRRAAVPGTRANVNVHVLAYPAGDPSPVTAQKNLAMVLPGPDQVDLIVHRVDHNGTSPMGFVEGTDAIRLCPYPNRATRFHCYLVNRSGRGRDVEVELVSVPEQPLGERVARSAVLDDSGEFLPGVKTVAGPVAVPLPASEEPVRLDFRPPAEEPENGAAAIDDAAAGAEAEQASTPTGSQAPDVTAGLVCVVRRSGVRRPDWLHFLQFAPVVPEEYVQPQVGYDEHKGQVTVEVAPGASAALPQLSAESPIRVRWPWEDPAVAPEGKYEAAIVQPRSAGTLYARVPRDPDREVSIPLEVDGYPRAFVYRVRCDRSRERIAPLIDLHRIGIHWPEENTVYPIPLREPIALRFFVDVPRDAFVDSGDRVEVRILQERGDRDACPEQARDFLTARQWRVELRSAGSALDVFATVSDFELALDNGGLTNTRVRLAARLRLSRLDRVVQHEVPITLDGASPVISSVSVPQSVEQGQPIEVRLAAEDLGGIDHIALGFEGEELGTFSETPKPVRMTRATGHPMAGRWTAAVPTAGIPTGEHRLMIRAVDVAGNPPTVSKHPVDIRPPKPPPGKKPESQPKKTSDIQGQVRERGGNPLRNIEIVLEGLKPTRSDGAGRFTFKDVPHGRHTIKASGILRGRRRETQATVTLPQAQEPAKVQLELEW